MIVPLATGVTMDADDAAIVANIPEHRSRLSKVRFRVVACST